MPLFALKCSVAGSVGGVTSAAMASAEITVAPEEQAMDPGRTRPSPHLGAEHHLSDPKPPMALFNYKIQILLMAFKAFCIEHQLTFPAWSSTAYLYAQSKNDSTFTLLLKYTVHLHTPNPFPYNSCCLHCFPYCPGKILPILQCSKKTSTKLNKPHSPSFVFLQLI